MTPIIYLSGSSSETDAVRLCRKKAMDCQRIALSTSDPKVRLRYIHLAKLWREMAGEAERSTNAAPSAEEKRVVIFPMQFQKAAKGVPWHTWGYTGASAAKLKATTTARVCAADHSFSVGDV
jgi:hypothetical protein